MQLRERLDGEASRAGSPGLPAGSRTVLRLLRRSGERHAGLAASVALHVLVLVAVVLALPEPHLTPPPPVESLPVELLSSEEIAALIQPPKPAIQTPQPQLEHEAATPPEPGLEPLPLTHAGTILSSRALDRTARESLASLATPARFEQICDVEAMEQIAKSKTGFHPTRAVAYALTDPEVRGDVMTADGAAFLSNGLWYRLSFRCETSPDRLKVVSFDFAVGGAITEGRGPGSDTAD